MQYSYVPVNGEPVILEGVQVPRAGLQFPAEYHLFNKYVPKVLNRYINNVLSNYINDIPGDTLEEVNFLKQFKQATGGDPVASQTNPLTGAVGIIGPGGTPVLDTRAVIARSVTSAPGTTVLDLSKGQSVATSVATQGCAAVWNPTGWDGKEGCLEITPDNNTWAAVRMYFDTSKQFDLWSDDGYAIEFEMPNLEGLPANPIASFRIGKGAVSTSVPADTREVRLFTQSTGTAYFSGRRYDRHRWDFTLNDATCGVWPGYNPGVTGSGVTKVDTINFVAFEFSRFAGKKVKIRRVVRGGKARPCIVFGTDSAPFYPLSELVNAYMSKLGWKWSINQYFAGSVDDLQASRDVINAIYASGSDYNINDLIDRNLATAGLTEQQVYEMAVECMQKASAYGWTRGQNVYIYNNNACTDQVVSGLSRAGVVAGRSGQIDGRYVFTEGGVVNPMRIPAASWDERTSEQMIAQVDRLIEYGATQWVYWHNVYSTSRVTDDGQTAVGSMTPSAYRAANLAYCSPRSINQYTVWWEELKVCLDYIKSKEMAGLIDVRSPSEWCRANGLGAIVF